MQYEKPISQTITWRTMEALFFNSIYFNAITGVEYSGNFQMDQPEETIIL